MIHPPKKPGRPPLISPEKESCQVHIRITKDNEQFLYKLGKGNISAGARKAIDIAAAYLVSINDLKI